MIFADLHLSAATTPGCAEACDELIRAIDAWSGPGVLVCNGGLFDGACDVDDVLAAHPRFAASLAAFAAGPARRLIVLPGFRDPELAWSADLRGALWRRVGAEIALSVDLEVVTAAGVSRVRVDPGARYDPMAVRHYPTNPAEVPLATHLRNQAAARVPTGAATAKRERWLAGIDELDDPGAVPRFIASRLVYRKLAKRAWLILLLAIPALALRIPLALLDRAKSGISDASRLELGAALTLLELVVLVVLAAVAVHQTWTALASITPSRDSEDANATPRSAARALVGTGYRGLISSHTSHPELTTLADGFYCNTGGTGATVTEVRSRLRSLGLPSVFIAARQVGWVELEAGNELHARLIYGRRSVGDATWLERIAAGGDATAPAQGAKTLHLDVVAVFPHGESWPPPVSSGRQRAWIRRLAATGVAAAGFLSLISALSEPFRDRLNVVRDVVPIVVPEAATALTALGALALLLLARGIRRGQRRAWAICLGLLLAIAVLHLVKGVNFEESLVALAAAAFLWINRQSFAAASDFPPIRRGLSTVVGCGMLVVVAAALGLEFGSWYSIASHHVVESRLSWAQAFQAATERMVGVDHVRLPTRLAEFFNPAMATVGIGLGVALAWLLLRPVVSRRAPGVTAASSSASDPDAMARARDILARHASGTLDYFALRSDKEFFFWGNTLVAYAVYNGTCLVSPDPVGPPTEAEEAWRQFRAFADTQGWALSVLGAGEDWLPIYRSTGMHDLYVGDEGVVRIERFTLEGGRFKGLRQAVNRVAKYGYTISFHDPATLDGALRNELEEVMTKSRRGDVERGFSMTLGRVFQPEDQGLLLAVVHGPVDSSSPDAPSAEERGPAVAFCQYVPAPGIGGYSLDLMRRDDGEHPNGLIDYAVVETIRYLKQQGKKGLGLNFATMRAVLAGEAGEGLSAKVQAWMLRRMGDSMQIESLWKFNAKFDPDWQPRYAIYDAPENALSTAIAVARAESFWELPVIGRFLVPSTERGAAGNGAAAAAGNGAEGNGAAAEGSVAGSGANNSPPLVATSPPSKSGPT